MAKPMKGKPESKAHEMKEMAGKKGAKGVMVVIATPMAKGKGKGGKGC